MSDAAPTQNNGQATGEPNSSQPQRGLWSSGLRIEQADGVPPDLIGKDIKEVAAEFERLKRESEAYKSALAAPPAPQYQPPQPPQQAAFSLPDVQKPDPALQYTNPTAYQQQLEAWTDYRVQQGIAQAAAPLLGNVAQLAKWQSQNDPNYAETWQKYGREIETMAAQVPAHMLNLNAYNTIAKVVKAEHIDELIDERAKKIAAAGGFGTERASPAGSVPAPSADKLSQLFQSDHPWVAKARANNVSEAEVRRYCSMRGINTDDYATDIMKGSVLAA